MLRLFALEYILFGNISAIFFIAGNSNLFLDYFPPKKDALNSAKEPKNFILGTLGFKDKYPAELVEKLLHLHLTNNNVRAKGEWFYISAKEAVLTLSCFPQGRKDISKKLEINDTKIINGIHLIDNASINEVLSEDECELLYEIFENSGEELYEFQNFTNLLMDS